MKTPKPQPVTFDYRNYRVTAINEAQTKFYALYDIVIYGGPVAHLSEYELSRKMEAYGSFVVSLPVVWNSRKEHDPNETRAHFVAQDVAFERRYTLYIPAEAVTIESTADHARKWAGYTERYYAVKDFPTAFTKLYRHPFNQYAAKDAVEELAKDYYDNLRYETINTPQAQERIAQVWQTLEEFSAEAARIDAMSDAEYIAECISAKEA